MKKLFLTNKSYYFLSLGFVLLLSFYPLMMGAQILTAYIRDGYVNTTDYPKYVIPYTPIAIALIISVALLPVAVKFCRKFSLPVISILGTGVFLLFELLFEQVTVFSIKEGTADIGAWQTYLCITTPEAMETIEYKETIGQSLSERYNPAFKIHFYLVAILIVLAVIGVVYGFGKMIREKNYHNKKPLIIQTAAVGIFIGLCVFACFTAFYRTGELNISAVSSWLMSAFFIMFGLTAGVYAGSLLYFKKPIVSRLVPALIAAIFTFLMYVGELILMGGVLFKFGSGFLFEPLGILPFALIDLFVIVISGGITYFILLKNKPV
ncbi:MAG: hypothetical protein FWG69_05330 [Oscillospiraceae bacterium]|nr:hypothetical protein [Oscillospiraceae bacterium]